MAYRLVDDTFKKEQLKKAKEHAISKGGQCLSNEYVNANAKMKWKCSNPEHPTWETKLNNVIKSGAWCRQCYKEDSINRNALILAKQFAKEKNGLCLSEQYIHSKKKLTWKCSNKEHSSWDSSYNNVMTKNAWCPECANDKFNNGLNRAHEYAKNKNGLCLSTSYLGSRIHLIWKCHNFSHNTWKSSLGDILSNDSWCPSCAREQLSIIQAKKDGLKLAYNYAKKYNGTCLSTEYINDHTKMQWKCSNEQHSVWKSSYATIVRKKSWCPECANSINISENRTRLILETFFKTKFKSCRPNWNKNPLTGYKLQLDGYCKNLNLAFEHDGEHHFSEICYGRKEKEGHFERQRQRDAAKKQNCINNGVTLLNIPIPNTKDRKNFQQFLNHVANECKKYGFNLTFSNQELITMEKKFYNM